MQEKLRFNPPQIPPPEPNPQGTGFTAYKQIRYRGVYSYRILRPEPLWQGFQKNRRDFPDWICIFMRNFLTQLETHEVIAGNGSCINDGTTILYEPGTISVFPANVPHEVIAGVIKYKRLLNQNKYKRAIA